MPIPAHAQVVRRGPCWLVRVTPPGRIVWRAYRAVAWQLSLNSLEEE